MNLFDLFASLSLNADKFYQGLNQAKQSANSFASGLTSGLSKALTSTGNSLTNIGRGISAVGDGITAAGQKASVVTGALGALLGATFTKAKSFIGTYESSMVVFRRKLEGGEEAAKNMYNELVRIAKGSAYAQEYIVSAGKTLVAMGNDANKTSKYVQAATDAVAAFGGSGTEVEELAHRFGRMSQQANIYTMDLNMLVDKGVPAWDILATKYKKTTAEIKEMVRQGMIPAKEGLEILTDAMEETNQESEMFQYSVAGMAQALKSGTLTGVLDSLNTSFRTFSLTLLDLDPREKTGMENIQKLNKAISMFGATMEKVGAKFSKVGKDLGSLFDKIADALGKFNEKLDALPEDKANAIVTILEGIAIAGPGLIVTGKAVSVYGKAVQGLGAIYTGLGKALDFSKITTGFLNIKKVFSGLMPNLKSAGNAFSNLFTVIKSMSPTVIPMLKNFWDNILSFGGKVGQTLSGAFSGFKTFFGYAQDVLGYVAGPIKNVFGGILEGVKSFGGMAGEMLGYMVEPFKQFAGNVAGVLQSMGGLLSETFSRIAEFGRNVSFVFVNLFNKISGFLQPLTSAFQSVFGAIGGIVGKLGPYIGKAFMGVGGAILKAFNIGGIVALLVAGLGILQQKFGDKIAEITSFLIEKAPEMIQSFVNGIIEKLPAIMEAGVQLLNTLIEVINVNLPILLNAGIQILVTLIQGLAAGLPQLISKIGEVIINIVNVITQNLPSIIQAGVEILSALLLGLAQTLPQLIPAAVDMIITLVMTLLDNIDQLIDAGIELLIGVADGIIKAIPILIDKAPIIIEKLVGAIVRNLPKIVQAGMELIIKLTVGIMDSLWRLGEKAPEIIRVLVNGLGSLMYMFGDIGRNIVEGVWNGISASTGWIVGKVQQFASSILNSMKAALGIQSPSKVMRDIIGKNIALGIGVGFEQEIDGVKKDMINSMDDLTKIGAADDVSYSASFNGKANAGLVNGLLSAIGLDGNQTTINLVVDGKTLAEVMYNPMSRLIQQRGAPLNA